MLSKKKRDFYEVLIAERLELLPQAEANAADRQKDTDGCHTSMLVHHHEFLALAQYLVHGDVAAFRSRLAAAAKSALTLLYRFDAGEPIDPSLVSMIRHEQLFDALAAADFSTASELAARIGSRHTIEREQNIPYTILLGYALKEAVLQTGIAAARDLERLLYGPDRQPDEEEDRDPDEGLLYGDFQGYADAFKAVAAADSPTLDRALTSIAEGHARQAKRGIYRGDIKGDLCIGAIAIANLAKHRGLQIHVQSPLVPSNLLLLK